MIKFQSYESCLYIFYIYLHLTNINKQTPHSDLTGSAQCSEAKGDHCVGVW